MHDNDVNVRSRHFADARDLAHDLNDIGKSGGQLSSPFPNDMSWKTCTIGGSEEDDIPKLAGKDSGWEGRDGGRAPRLYVSKLPSSE